MDGKLLLIATASLALGSATLSCSGDWDPTTGGSGGGVLPASLVGIGVSPQDPKVTFGETLQFRATGFYADQTTRDITDTVDWYSSDAQVLTVSDGLDSEGLGTTVGPGTAQVEAGYFDLSSNRVRVTVTEASIEELSVTPPTVSLHVGETVQLQANATFSDGSHGNVTGSVRWLTDSPEVASVDISGVVEGQGLGNASIRAIYETAEKEFEATPSVIGVVGGDVTIDGADLRILGVSAASDGQSVTYTVQIKNSGGSPASSFWVDAWLNRTGAPPTPPTTGDAYEMVSLLQPGDTHEVAVELDAVSPGTYQSWLMIDSFNGTFEGSLGENNNIWGPEQVTVSGGSGPIGADLSITYLQGFVQEAQGQVLYVIDVTNTGDATASTFSVGVFTNPTFPPVAPATPDEQVEVLDLAPGNTAYLSLVVRDVPESYWQSYVLADSGGLLSEPNEGNNIGSFQIVP